MRQQPDELIDVAGPTHEAKEANEPGPIADHSQDVAVEENQVDERRTQFFAAQEVQILDSHIERWSGRRKRNEDEWVGGDMGDDWRGSGE